MSGGIGGGAGGLGVGLMSCVREGSLEPPYHPPPHTDNSRHGEGRTNRFLRGLRRMFKRRGSGTRTAPDASPDPKSRSTSELLDAERHARKKEGVYSSGLSVSHDSVFTGERSGDESSDERPTPAHGLAHIASSHRAELVAAVRRRGRGDGSDDDEDLGLPRSPPASPPTDKADKRHHAGISQSSCSDGSLLSVGSSEMDEDSSSGTHHLSTSHDHSNRSDLSDFYNSSEPPSGVAPLSHSAAKHKMAVRPRRTHGAPRRKKNNPIAANALPITPELNEEMIRSTTPEVIHKSSEVVTESFSSSNTTKHHITVKEHQQQLNRELQRVLDATPTETKLKSSSLPPGLALSQLVGHSPAKLTIAESDTPRSSIKRSKSSSQGKSLRDESPKHAASSTSESQINSYHSEEKMSSKYRSDNKYAEEPCLADKKTKSEKKVENEVIRSTKKEESFFSRLLLRKSGKKSKKDQIDGETQQETKKSKTEKIVATPQYKHVDMERSTGFSYGEYGHGQHKSTGDKITQKSAGQRAYSNQVYKRLDSKGAYSHDGIYKDAYSAAKISGADYNITDLKIAEETDKMLNMDMKTSYSRREDTFNEKIVEKPKRTSSKETIDEVHNRDSYNFCHDRSKRPQSNLHRMVDPYPAKAFINNERANLARDENLLSPTLVVSEEEPLTRAPRFRSVHNDYSFHSGSMPKNIPYFNPNITLSASASPPKSILHHSSENVKHFNRSTEHISEYSRERQNTESSKHVESSQHNFQHVVSKTDSQGSYVNSGLRSLGDEYVEARSSIGKSHSFRYASETNSISSQESQMPSLPAIVGISEPLLESWEANYRRSVTRRVMNEINDYSHRAVARNYNLNFDNNYDSLPSTDSSYMDSLKTETQPEVEMKSVYTNNIHIKMDSHKRDSDISQIEAKIDDIISSPKPLMTPILKSSSLDSVKSTPDKLMDDRRKTVSVESALSNSGKLNNSPVKKASQNIKQDTENFISVTHLNKEPNTTPIKVVDLPKIVKSEEKQQAQAKSTKPMPGVPEFFKIQLNKVDTKPPSNIVLTANITPKKIDTQQRNTDDINEEIGSFEGINNIKISNCTGQIQKLESQNQINKTTENIIDNSQSDVIVKGVSEKLINNQIKPQSPSTPKTFFKRKSTSVELQDKPDKSRTNSMSTEGSNEKIYDNFSMDQKSHSSFGSKSSIQSTDSNEARTPERDDGVVLRRKPVMLTKELRGDKRKDDEPELMKVFARRSLKLKDSDVDTLAHDLAEVTNSKDELNDITATKSKTLKNEFNASIKSRDSDKENEDTICKDQNIEEKRVIDIAARVSQFGVPHYQRSVSITSVTSANANTKRDSAPIYQKSDVNKYKKEVSDSTPEKRLRNRTFPDSSNDREDIKSIAVKNEVLGYKADTLTKRPWQKKDEDSKKTQVRHLSLDMKEKSQVRNENAVIEKDEEKSKEETEKEKEVAEGEADGSPQFKGILQMRAEWERRAKQGMTK